MVYLVTADDSPAKMRVRGLFDFRGLSINSAQSGKLYEIIYKPESAHKPNIWESNCQNSHLLHGLPQVCWLTFDPRATTADGLVPMIWPLSMLTVGFGEFHQAQLIQLSLILANQFRAVRQFPFLMMSVSPKLYGGCGGFVQWGYHIPSSISIGSHPL